MILPGRVILQYPSSSQFKMVILYGTDLNVASEFATTLNVVDSFCKATNQRRHCNPVSQA
jgi:hypothetical protein